MYLYNIWSFVGIRSEASNRKKVQQKLTRCRKHEQRRNAIWKELWQNGINYYYFMKFSSHAFAVEHKGSQHWHKKSFLKLSEFIFHKELLQFSHKRSSRATDLATVSDSLSEYCPGGIGSYWASTICARQTKYYSYCHAGFTCGRKMGQTEKAKCTHIRGIPQTRYISRYKLKRSSGLRLSA